MYKFALILYKRMSLVWSCSVSINSCKSESVKLLQEAMPKVTDGQNSCNGWANAM